MLKTWVFVFEAPRDPPCRLFYQSQKDIQNAHSFLPERPSQDEELLEFKFMIS